jgi:MazG family protein
VSEKLIRRHPHVFGDDQCADSDAVLKRWDEIKRAEKGDQPRSALDGVPSGFAALMRAEKVQKKAAKVGFDWSEIAPVVAKVREELAEVEQAGSDRAKLEEEIGDLLFATVNLARKLKVDAEVALQAATNKFVGRFHAVEAIAAERGLVLDQLSLAQLDEIWDEVKGRGGS